MRALLSLSVGLILIKYFMIKFLYLLSCRKITGKLRFNLGEPSSNKVGTMCKIVPQSFKVIVHKHILFQELWAVIDLYLISNSSQRNSCKSGV